MNEKLYITVYIRIEPGSDLLLLQCIAACMHPTDANVVDRSGPHSHSQQWPIGTIESRNVFLQFLAQIQCIISV